MGCRVELALPGQGGASRFIGVGLEAQGIKGPAQDPAGNWPVFQEAGQGPGAVWLYAHFPSCPVLLALPVATVGVDRPHLWAHPQGLEGGRAQSGVVLP